MSTVFLPDDNQTKRGERIACCYYFNPFQMFYIKILHVKWIAANHKC